MGKNFKIKDADQCETVNCCSLKADCTRMIVCQLCLRVRPTTLSLAMPWDKAGFGILAWLAALLVILLQVELVTMETTSHLASPVSMEPLEVDTIQKTESMTVESRRSPQCEASPPSAGTAAMTMELEPSDLSLGAESVRRTVTTTQVVTTRVVRQVTFTSSVPEEYLMNLQELLDLIKQLEGDLTTQPPLQGRLYEDFSGQEDKLKVRKHRCDISVENGRPWTNAGLLLDQRRGRWTNIKPALVTPLLFAVCMSQYY